MNENNYIEICNLVAKNLKIDPDTVSLTSSITEDLGGDSLNKVEIIMALEQKFNVSIPDDFTNTYTTVEDLAKFIQDNN
jgi:acyl carrier protein|tara:strand:- start:118 stop:354 length:237 start_codon:yes stop_codon:yes gene_type:complete